jgi:methionyl-tRNA formyltransferase
MQPGALVVASFGQLLKDELLQLAPWGSFNVHGSLLPRHRGASPVAAAILAGDEETGVTVQKMVKRLDAGAIGAIERTEIRPRETAGELSDRLAHLGAGLLVSFLDRLEQGDVEFVQQDEENATYCGKLSKDSGQIDWRDSAATIERFVRAMTPWPGARAKVVAAHSAGGGDATIPMKVLESIVKEDSAPGGPPGTILKLPSEPRGSMPESLDVTTGRGVLRIVRLHPEGGKPQSAAEFLRGRRLVAGSAMRSLPADA